MTDDKDTTIPEQEDAKEKALRVEQDSRVAEQKAKAEAKGSNTAKPGDGTNQDG